jgi:hypothetical protein
MRFARFVVFLFLFLTGLLGLAMTVCGGGFFAFELRDALRNPNIWGWYGLSFAFVSFAIGLSLLYFAWSRAKRVDK